MTRQLFLDNEENSMQQIKYASFPALLDDFEKLSEEIDAAIKRTMLMLGGILLPCAVLVIYALSSAGR